MPSNHKHWLFTSFDLTLLEKLPSLVNEPWFYFCTYQLEQAPTTERQHVQGYLECHDSVGLHTVQLRLGDVTAHVEPRQGLLSYWIILRGAYFFFSGTRQQAIAYCRKEETRLDGPFTFGTEDRPTERHHQGHRSDLEAVFTAVRGGVSELELASRYPAVYLKFFRGIERARRLVTPRRDWPTSTVVYWGPTESGQSLFDVRDGLFVL